MNTHLRSPNASSSFPSLLSRTFADLSRKVRTQRKEQPLVQSLWERARLRMAARVFKVRGTPRERGRRLNMQNTFSYPTSSIRSQHQIERGRRREGGNTNTRATRKGQEEG